MFLSVSMQKLYVLEDLYVDPAHKGKGIGKTLLNKGKEYKTYELELGGG